VGTGLGASGNWAYGILVIHMNEEDRKFEKKYRNKFVYFFYFLPSNTKGFDNHSYE